MEIFCCLNWSSPGNCPSKGHAGQVVAKSLHTGGIKKVNEGGGQRLLTGVISEQDDSRSKSSY